MFGHDLRQETQLYKEINKTIYALKGNCETNNLVMGGLNSLFATYLVQAR